jgi:hypothetical protein
LCQIKAPLGAPAQHESVNREEINMTKTTNILAALLLSFSAAVAAADAPVAHIRVPATALPMPYVIEFEQGATIDFADFTQHQPGPLRGYVYVRLQGELVVIPVYHPVADGTMWRIEPRSTN